jgi:thiosulfate dehydrogenase (quinone) large subunit
MTKKQPSVNDYALAWLRIAVGLLFLVLAQYKVWDAKFAHGGFEASMRQFLRSGAYPFMAPVLRGIVPPHLTLVAHLVAYGELCIGISLLLGIMVRTASFFGLIYMIVLLLSSAYPGPHAAIWQYFAAAVNELGYAFCFVAFGMGDAARVWSVPGYYRRNLRGLAGGQMENGDPGLGSSNVFGK